MRYGPESSGEMLRCAQHDLNATTQNTHSFAIPSRIRAFAFNSLVCGILLLVTGCTVGPDYRRPEMDLPGGFGAWAAQAKTGTTQPATQAVDFARWWTVFHDPQLNALIDRAMAGNLDLQSAAARVREARGQRGISASSLFPTVNTDASYRRSQTSENAFNFGGSQGASSGNAGGSGGLSSGSSGAGFAAPGSTTDLYQAGFDASWEIDLFGGVRRAVEAADAEVASQIENQRDVLVSLIAEVARNYLEVRGFQSQIEIAHRNVKIQTDAVEVARSKARLAGGSDLEVARSEALVAQTRSQIPFLEQQRDASIHRLATLQGLPPRSLYDILTAAKPIPQGPPSIPPGLPAELLRRRPDIRRAERELAAATARIGEATADLYPRFSLTGAIGLQSQTMKHFADWQSHFWNIGPSMSWPIFDAGKIRSNITVQDERTKQADLNYRKTVLSALEEVENALTAYSKEQSRRDLLAVAVERNRRSVELANTLYQNGARDFLNVIDAQRALLSTEDLLAQSDRLVATNLVGLYKALGGGWDGD